MLTSITSGKDLIKDCMYKLYNIERAADLETRRLFTIEMLSKLIFSFDGFRPE